MFERLTKVERAGLLAIALLTALVLIAEYAVSFIPPPQPTAEELSRMEAFERQVRAFDADTVVEKPAVKKTKKTKHKSGKRRQPQREGDMPGEKIERYERD